MARLRIEAQGVVQGVGFRPFVFRLAHDLGLAGWVQNRPEGVRIEVQGPEPGLDAFLRRLDAEKPAAARFQLVAEPVRDQSEAGPFRILASAQDGERRPSIPADLATCPQCAAEIRDPGARRFRYPFTNCTACGPRYSIIAALPYDRPRTAMAGFPLCPECRREYEDPLDRRFHAQPIACPRCGPCLAYHAGDGRGPDGAAALAQALALLRRGGILALKGLGGFQLLVDAGAEPAVRRLRERKGRAGKPFAVMFPDREALLAACAAGPEALAALEGPEAPILLLPRRASCRVAAAVAPGNPDLGAFLPSTPLHRLLLEGFGAPLVCTSGNRSEEPMAIDDTEARSRLGAIADGFLGHDRPVLRPVDDSVGRIEQGRLHLLRRARGFAPLPLALDDGPVVLALGGHHKATVTLLARGLAVVSQHLGDLDSVLGPALLERTAEDLLGFLDASAERLACDLHPGYASTRVAEAMARRLDRPLVRVQHHHAHVAAAMAEHGLDGPVLGLAWDGAGYGPDGTVWGGEALAVAPAGWRRLGRLRPFPLPGGEQAVREPRRSALGLCWACLGQPGPAAALFSRSEAAVLARAMERRVNAPWCSSMGRLFDAVAALLGLGTATFEGEAAMALEFQARLGRDSGAYAIPLDRGEADPAPLIEALLEDRRRGRGLPAMAFRFHAALAGLALGWSEASGLGTVVLTGGCFQNPLLAALCRERLEAGGFRVVRPERFPPNDGGLSLGQAWIASRKGTGA